MFIFSGNVENAYARNIVEWSSKLGNGFCSAFGEQYEPAENETFLAFVYVLAEKLHVTLSKSRSPVAFKKSLPTKIQAAHHRRHGAGFSYARLVTAFDRMRSLLDGHLSGFLEAHLSGSSPALEMHTLRITPILYQQTFGRVVPHMARHLENLTKQFTSIVDEVMTFAVKH